eukprot:4001208-Pyramimonas_sp.AAC.1
MFLTAVKWRFSQYEHFPFRRAQMAHPACSKAGQSEVFTEFYGLPECCLDPHFSCKLRKLVPSQDQLQQSKEFFRLIVTWCQNFQATGMFCERLLALTRQCADSGE